MIINIHNSNLIRRGRRQYVEEIECMTHAIGAEHKEKVIEMSSDPG